MKLDKSKCLIAYFSRPGNNYVSGRIVNLAVGNTEVAAKIIQEITGGDLFCIKAVKEYPRDYMETTEVAQQELRSNARPELVNHLNNLANYDVIFLGYPNWWSSMPMPVYTFLEEYDFSGKTIIPFCTHEGSGIGHTEKDIARLCPDASLLQGIAIYGSRVKEAKEDILDWLNEIQ